LEDPDGQITARLIGWAYPERLALARGRGDGRFLLHSGRGATLPPHDPLASAEALAIAAVDGAGTEARVLLAARLDRGELERMAASSLEARQEVRWDPRTERVRCEEVRCFGLLVLSRAPWSEAPETAVCQAMLEGLESMGLEALPWSRETRQLRQRLVLAHGHLGPPWPDRRLETLRATLAEWLGPFLDASLRSRADLQRLPLADALWGDCDWASRQRLDALLPTHLPVPSGRPVALDYHEDQVVLAVKLQEMFGQVETPSLLNGQLPITVHLLSPAGRPLAITADLRRFWSQGYPLVRRDLRGRYPRHPWPEDPLTAIPTALTRARLRASGSTSQK
jgi:ATP-dependent helicase HrpB